MRKKRDENIIMAENQTEDKQVKKTPVEEAKASNEELKQVIEEKKQLYIELERLRAMDTLGGKSEAGTSKPVEETPKEYAKRILRGGK